MSGQGTCRPYRSSAAISRLSSGSGHPTPDPAPAQPPESHPKATARCLRGWIDLLFTPDQRSLPMTRRLVVNVVSAAVFALSIFALAPSRGAAQVADPRGPFVGI